MFFMIKADDKLRLLFSVISISELWSPLKTIVPQMLADEVLRLLSPVFGGDHIIVMCFLPAFRSLLSALLR